ncbi:hypothetical protein TW74_24050 [Vibrio nigripulchritudo]|nr:hypothetical protein TW74_24050 [Vibrio nigripulchritudo]
MGAVNDGINEKGLVTNLLWFTEAKYPKPEDQPENKKPICVSIWAQFILDICDSVESAIEAMQHVYVQGGVLPSSNKEAKCHLAVADKNGKVAIFEYIEHELHISSNVVPDGDVRNYRYYDLREICVMTNEPDFSKQIEINNYWRLTNEYKSVQKWPINLPGTSNSIDRFVRASYYTRHLQQDCNNDTAIAGVASVMHNVSRPIGLNTDSTSEKPNESRTWFINMANQISNIYFYQSVYSPYMIWLDLNDIVFAESGKDGLALKLTLDDAGVAKDESGFIHGNVTQRLNTSAPEKVFSFFPSDAKQKSGSEEFVTMR